MKLSEIVESKIKEIFLKKKNLSYINLVFNWKIIATRYNKFSFPLGVFFNKENLGVLKIAVQSNSIGIEMKFESFEIIQKSNLILGHKLINKIHVEIRPELFFSCEDSEPEDIKSLF